LIIGKIMKQKYSTKKGEKGQGLVEYTLTAILAALVGAGVWMAFGPEIRNISNDLTERVSSSGFSINDGVMTIPGLSPSLTPVTSAIPTNTPILIASSTPTLIASSTPTQLACTSGNATNITSKTACKNLRDSNNCEKFSYNSKKDTCSWY